MFLAALDKNETVFARCLSLKHGQTADKEGFLALHWAVLSRWQEGVRLALESGTPVDSLSTGGYSALHLASFVGSIDCARLLLNAGANVALKTQKQATALGLAAQHGLDTKDVLEFLLHHGASPTDRGYRHYTALETAILSPKLNIDAVEAILANGGDPRATNPHLGNFTPVHLAAKILNSDVARALLNAGGDPNALADRNVSPLMVAYSPRSVPRQNVVGPPNESIEAKRRAMFGILCSAGANVGAVIGTRNLTALHAAFMSSKEEATIDQILSAPSCDPSKNINIKLPQTQLTMLQTCARNGWANAARILAETPGVDLEFRNKEGFTALHMVVLKNPQDLTSSQAYAQVVTALLEAGADPGTLAPDVYPDVRTWRVKQGMLTAHAILHGVNDQNELKAHLHALNKHVTAVDTAFLVTQNIPVIEAFLEFGVKPSEEAQEVGEECVPILENIVKRTPWTPEMHANLPLSFKSAAQELVLSLRRAAQGSDGQVLAMSEDVLSVILTQALYPISAWADDEWMNDQRVKEAHQVQRPNHAEDATIAAANGVFAVFGGEHGQGHIMDQEEAMAAHGAIMQALPEVVGQIVNFMNQHPPGFNMQGGQAGQGGGGGGGNPQGGQAGGGGGEGNPNPNNNNNGGNIDLVNMGNMHPMLPVFFPGFAAAGGAAGEGAAGEGGVPNAGLGLPPPNAALAAALDEMMDNPYDPHQPHHHHIMQMQMHLPGGGVMMMGDEDEEEVDEEGDGGMFIGHQIFHHHHHPGMGNAGGTGGLPDLLQAAANQAVEAVQAAAVGGGHLQGMPPGGIAPGQEGEVQVMQVQIHINMDDLLAAHNNNNNQQQQQQAGGGGGNAGGGGGGLANHPVAQHFQQLQQQMEQHVAHHMQLHHQQQQQQQMNQPPAAAPAAAPPAPATRARSRQPSQKGDVPARKSRRGG